MAEQITFFIEGQAMDPHDTAVMNPLVEAIANQERQQSLGKTALLNPTTIEVSLGANMATMENDFKVTSWHETSGSPAGRLQVHQTDIDIKRSNHDSIVILGESGTRYGLTPEQRICGAALFMTNVVGLVFRQLDKPGPIYLPEFPFGLN